MSERYMQLFSYNKQKYETILDDPQSRLGRFVDMFLFYLVLLFSVVLIFESIGDNYIRFEFEIYIFDAIISSIFALEYCYRLIKAKDKLSFLVNPMRIIDLLSFLPFFLGYVTSGSFLKILRMLRALRILRLIKRIPLTAGFVNALKDYIDEYKAVFTLYFIILFLGSTFVYYAEKDVIGSNFTSIPQSLWWGLVTMSTVGYGDIAPQTEIGKILGSVLVVLGPLIGSLIGAVTIMVFMETAKAAERAGGVRGKVCHKCHSRSPREAHYCFKCGEKLLANEHGKSEAVVQVRKK